MLDKKFVHACCFTGHRPERLEMPPKKVIHWLNEQIDNAISDGYTTFISGMQRGVDIWAAEAVVNKIKEGANVNLVAACAFKGMEDRWERSWQDRYKMAILLGKVYIGPGRKRNM